MTCRWHERQVIELHISGLPHDADDVRPPFCSCAGFQRERFCGWIFLGQESKTPNSWCLAIVGKTYGYGSIAIDTFLVGWTSRNPSYFDVNYRGTRFWHAAIYLYALFFFYVRNCRSSFFHCHVCSPTIGDLCETLTRLCMFGDDPSPWFGLNTKKGSQKKRCGVSDIC